MDSDYLDRIYRINWMEAGIIWIALSGKPERLSQEMDRFGATNQTPI